MFILGVAAFGLFFLGDWNDWKLGKRCFRVCFPAGFLLLSVVTIFQALRGEAPFSAVVRGIGYVLAAIFLVLEVGALFVSLPAAEAYGKTGEERSACTRGMYGLCRHPGVLWFIPLYLCLWLAAGLPLPCVAVYSGLNLLLIWFEDRWVFPARLEGYEAYRETTPFLLPNGASLRAFFGQADCK